MCSIVIGLFIRERVPQNTEAMTTLAGPFFEAHGVCITGRTVKKKDVTMKPRPDSLLYKTDPSQPAKPQFKRSEREFFYCNKKGHMMAECRLRKAAQMRTEQKAASAVHDLQRKDVTCRAEPKEQSVSAVQKSPEEIQVNKGGFQSTPMVFSSCEETTVGIASCNITVDEGYVGSQKVTAL